MVAWMIHAHTDEEHDLANAMLQLLDDMGEEGLCVCEFAKAKARIAYEPYCHESDRAGLLLVEEARRIVEMVEKFD
jgi:hypothetical protein